MTAANRRFALHYLEMVVVMVVGMEVLGAAVGLVHDVNSAGAMLMEMVVTMTVPMVAWMRIRGHAWRPSLEMGASMVLPTLGTLALLGAGVVEGAAALMVILHAVMLPAMLFAMLLRRDEYSCHHQPLPGDGVKLTDGGCPIAASASRPCSGLGRPAVSAQRQCGQKRIRRGRRIARSPLSDDRDEAVHRLFEHLGFRCEFVGSA